MSPEYRRTFPLEDIRILSRAQGSEYADGRTVEAYAAVFDSPTEIYDGQGHYLETIDRSAFDEALKQRRPQANRATWNVGVFYNHGMTMHGTPSDAGGRPVATALDVRADKQGLLTLSRYANTPLGDEVLELIRSGALTAQSFSGKIMRSSPNPPRVGYRPRSDGQLVTVKRLELGLREYGPTPFPAYADASIVGVRAALAQLLSSTFGESPEEPVEPDTSPDEEAVPDEPPAAGEHSSRDLHRAAVLERIANAKRTRPGLTRQEGNP